MVKRNEPKLYVRDMKRHTQKRTHIHTPEIKARQAFMEITFKDHKNKTNTMYNDSNQINRKYGEDDRHNRKKQTHDKFHADRRTI